MNLIEIASYGRRDRSARRIEIGIIACKDGMRKQASGTIMDATKQSSIGRGEACIFRIKNEFREIRNRA
jgi:hypothetical protein